MKIKRNAHRATGKVLIIAKTIGDKLKKLTMIKRINDVICELEKKGYNLRKDDAIKIPQAFQKIEMIGKQIYANFEMLEEYKLIADFFENGTQGRSLALIGAPGTGKTFFATRLLPVLLKMELNKECTLVNATELADNLRKYKQQNYLVVDDVGTEEDAMEYGYKTHQFSEWINSVEYRDCFSVITTNLNGEQIKKKYDARVYDRIKGCFKVILFKNQSFRKQ